MYNLEGISKSYNITSKKLKKGIEGYTGYQSLVICGIRELDSIATNVLINYRQQIDICEELLYNAREIVKEQLELETDAEAILSLKYF